MTKQEFVAKVQQKSGLSSRDAGKAVDAFIESVTDALKSGDSVTFTGFGKFSTSQRARVKESIRAIRARKCTSRPRACRSSRRAAR